ncbi:TonB-dependent receptor domain-containing protein [Sphingopyxis indica]|uniref:TonB-dependent Receptor Plug Domain n=1 Tax=Sphingopyxis indica TaxID=436663 RepID=A0A239KIG2_9SPHN|nr:TonB-dependent receptor [Sphingopyxis indica]SNT17488.1 TonB-dependent Receptor Plug Domain [Sphingopyxis indica]
MKKTHLSALKRGAAPFVLGVGLLAMATPAMAQDAPADEGAADIGAPIVVTGSRIKQPNLESASPVTVISNVEFKQTGTTRVEDLVNSLPQAFAAQGANVSNGATGTATLNLRGLGDERTLVLVNGRRLVPGDPTSSAADINVIPAALIERVDVLTGGASSVYGADAVAGVVNFVMDTDFEGFKLDTQYSLYNHDNRNKSKFTDPLDASGNGYPRGMSTNGGTFDATLAFGAGFDDGRGHVSAYVGYRKINPVNQATRDYSACALSANSAASVAAGGRLYNCGGSATSPQGTIFAYDSFGDPTDANGDGVADSFTSTIYQFGPNRTLLPGFTPYNFAPLNYFQRPDERYTAGVFADYEVSEALHPYMEFMFMDDRTVAQIAPSGNFGNSLSINCDNPLLSAEQLAVICDTENLLVSPAAGDAFTVVGNVAAENQARIDRGLGEPLLPTTPFGFIDPTTGATYNRGFAQILRRNVEGGPRRDDLQHTSYRAVLGTRGDLSPAWSYDIYYQYGRTNFAETYTNDFSVTRLTRALDVVTDANGNAVCRSTLDGTDPNCVPWDIFSPGTSTPSQDAVNYISTPGFQRGIVSEQVLSGYVAGSLGEYGIQSPWADEGVSIVLGGEYRKEKLEFLSDLAFQTGDLAGQGAPTLPVSGSFNVKEFFSEVRLPIVQDSWLYDLSITGGYRYSDYSTGASTDTYKIEGELAPTRDIRIRGGYNRAVRAPTVQDLFAPQRVALDGSTDPCSGAPIAAGDVGCLASGLSVGQVVAPNPASQYNGLIGGNPDLVPEVADTYTAGVVLTPGFLPGFNASVDYFNIKVKGAIQGIGADTILNQCDRDTADPFFCSLVVRDASGSLWRSSGGYVTDLSQNIGRLETSGIDVQAGYSREIGNAGRLGLTFVGTWLDKLTSNPGVGPDVECAGLYGNVCGTPNPEWRHTARLSFDMPNGFGASVRWRYFGSVDVDSLSDTTQPGIAGFDAVSYFDLALTGKFGDHYDFRLGMNNVFDKEPPVTGSQACPAGFCNGNVFAQVYDALGRYIYAGVTLDF